MCGRYTLTASGREIARVFAARAMPSLFEQPRFNIAPTQRVPVVVRRAGERQLTLMRWGLVPRWADDPAVGNRMINARAETAAVRPAFRDAWQRRRCLVPADGFYEWQRNSGGATQPYHLRPEDHSLFAFAGLWDCWQGEVDAEPLHTFTILTTDASEAVRSIHDRMPLILSPEHWPMWLDPSLSSLDVLKPLLRPWPGRLAATPVSRHVNNPRHDDPHCLDPLMFPPIVDG